MCGIFGFFGGSEKLPSRQDIESALSTLIHRGPDARGLLWQPENGLALGHTRLSIIDPTPRSDQPFSSPSCDLVFNGEIYNYRELREELRKLGAVFHTDGDTEVISVGYDYWGCGIFNRLRGMYALALYDTRERCLRLVRDEFGIKPLCYIHRNNSIIFASEIKAIAALTSLSIDGGILTDMLSWGFQMEDTSLYSGVRYLPPGTIMTLRFSKVGKLEIHETECYFSKRAYTQRCEPIDTKSLHDIVQRSVEDHLIADVPVAIALSGGLDSSIIAAAASQVHPGLRAFTFTLSENSDPEVEHAAKLCQHLGLDHCVARLKINSTEGCLRRVAWHLEEPIANINALTNYGLASLIRNQGFKVVLVGEGADELFAGYPWYRFALDQKLANDSSLIFDAYHRRRAQSGLMKILRSEAQSNALRRLENHSKRFGERLYEIPHSPLDGFLSFDQSTQLQYSQLLRVDRMFMAHGIEARVPFLHRSVLKASASLSSSDKLHISEVEGRAEKIALANSFSKYLPRSIAMRPKFGIQGTVNIWNTDFPNGLESEYDRCLHGDELRGARQLLDEFIDWKQVRNQKLSAKEKFSSSLIVEAVDCLLLSRRKYDEPSLFNWEIVS